MLPSRLAAVVALVFGAFQAEKVLCAAGKVEARHAAVTAIGALQPVGDVLAGCAEPLTLASQM
jgi:hypothetical protein